MNWPVNLQEPMSMPDPSFPIKVNFCGSREYGQVLFPHHWHRHMEFLYVESGEAMIECNAKPIHVQAGDLIVLNSHDLHQGISLSSELVYYALIADLQSLQSPSQDAVETRFITPMTQNRLIFHSYIRGDTGLQRCMEDIIDEFRDRRIGHELAVKSLMYRLLALLVRGYVDDLSDWRHTENRMRNVERFTPILQHIEQHYAEEMTIEQLAELAGLSRFHFSRVFRELTGRTVTEYVNQVRINRAEYLLLNTGMTVSEVAMAAGYNDISYFSRTFKKYRDRAPSDARAGRI
ncbi:AraC family transcriptional regulator [Paenibacillus hunanensis]|uniref:AraC family transcriptional regulator n=1 Tax=Paenibacillus hunanensis TaxID=539262 RepID=UPI0020261F12|nr:AraC family transcriptional regulator [Paenibacillus hunanensis]MCL9659621.1 AraC family transcriptional regulator [Paenibacillus hunanensis]